MESAQRYGRTSVHERVKNLSNPKALSLDRFCATGSDGRKRPSVVLRVEQNKRRALYRSWVGLATHSLSIICTNNTVFISHRLSITREPASFGETPIIFRAVRHKSNVLDRMSP